MIQYVLFAIIIYLWLSHIISYKIIKQSIFKSQIWGLNICCGKTDGGGVNADVVKHTNVPNFKKIDNIYKLPFKDNEFKTVLCSHTIEHVQNPEKFYRELLRVGKKVVLVIPPLYDITAVLNIIEHKWIFLSFKKKHTTLPIHIKLPMSDFFHKHFGQNIKA
ncbi:MAG: hypothetical protein MAG795_00284 [Candidatus Woesearchaeota archaeon]|nr:hypothetical protein [Candidatus Woesearchaeota archaeon]